MPSPCKKLKKSNDEEEHRNKTANEKWVEGYNYFLSQEGQEEHQRKNEEWHAHVRKHREETGDNIDAPISDIVSSFQTHPNSLMNKSFRRYLAQSNTATQKEDNKLSGNRSIEMRIRRKTGRRVLTKSQQKEIKNQYQEL
jgi:hypothetical protein